MTVLAAVGNVVASFKAVDGLLSAFVTLFAAVIGVMVAFAPMGGIAGVCKSALATVEECKAVSTTVLTAVGSAIVSADRSSG